MKNPVSIFIMDISNSSDNAGFGTELERYLAEIEQLIKSWVDGIVPCQISRRRGDEIIFISKNYATAYIIAFYLGKIWKYTNHSPYFGLSFGNVEADLNRINPETWIHPLVKQARIANDELKSMQADRIQYRFNLVPADVESRSHDSVDILLATFETLINSILENQNVYLKKQTEIQKLTTALYVILAKQKKIAAYLNKTPATISSHLNKGNGHEILKTFKKMTEALTMYQISIFTLENMFPDEELFAVNDRLNNKIKKDITEKIDTFF